MVCLTRFSTIPWIKQCYYEQTYSTHTHTHGAWRFPHSVPSCDAAMAKEGSDITVWLCSEGEVGRSERQTVLWLWHCQLWCQLPFRPRRRRHTHRQKGQSARGPTVMETRTDSSAFLHTFLFFSPSLSRRSGRSRSCLFFFVRKCKFPSKF